jgi:sugar fermentation stimulation protein A
MLTFSSPLHKAYFTKRYKRFFVDATLAETGELVTAHCPNTGTLKTCCHEGATIYLSLSDNPNRKLRYTWEFTALPSGLIGVNTAIPNQVIEAAIANEKIPELRGYRSIRREVKYGQNSRIDLLLEDHPQQRTPCYVEIKNATLLLSDGVAGFPDAVTARGQKHLEELMAVAEGGARAVTVFFVNRPDAQVFRPADAIDPQYGQLLRKAARKGVEIFAIPAKSTVNGIDVGSALPVEF